MTFVWSLRIAAWYRASMAVESGRQLARRLRMRLRVRPRGVPPPTMATLRQLLVLLAATSLLVAPLAANP